MRLILVRHGRTTSNVGFLLDTGEPGAELDDYGRSQARSLVDRLAGHDFEAIFVSNLVRTQQTARPIARARSLDFTVLPGLREISAGEDELSTDATRYIDTLQAWAAGEPNRRIPGGENAHEFFTRYDASIRTISEAGHETVMAVSHGAAIRVWASARVAGFTEAIGEGHFDNTGFLVLEGSLEDGWSLTAIEGVRYYAHVPAEGGDAD